MKIKPFILVASISVLVVLNAFASEGNHIQEGTKQDDAIVRSVLIAYVAGRDARDIEAVQVLLSADIDQLTSRGEWRYGIDATTAGMKRSSKNNPGKRTIEVESVRFLHPDVALADARYIIKGTDGPDRILWSSFTLVKASDGKWLITSIRNQKPAK